jgi:N-acetylglucosamine-6-phosphate deacetylase
MRLAAGVRVSAGHSEASADVMMRAVADGLTGVTHLFNARFSGKRCHGIAICLLA